MVAVYIASKILLATIVVASLADPVAAQSAVQPEARTWPVREVREVRDLRYVAGEKSHRTKHLLDLYLPVGLDGAPLVMFIHGGAWKLGDKRQTPRIYANVGRAIARAGFGCAVINYRLTPEVVHPGHIEDCAAAFAWLHDNAGRHGLDASRMFVSGQSAGAHLCALLATDPKYLRVHGLELDAIAGAIPISGVFDVRVGLGWLREAFGPDAAVRRDASPMLNVDGDEPPFALLWAEDEMLNLEVSSKMLARRLRRHGIAVEAAEIAGRTHVTIITEFGSDGDATAEKLLAFVRRRSDEKTAAEKRSPQQRSGDGRR